MAYYLVMSLSRKHFEAVAEIIQTRKGTILRDPAAGFDEGFEAGQTVMLEDIANDLANYFGGENPNFDVDRFLKASGIGQVPHVRL